MLPVAIIGAGPAGLASAASLRARNVPYRLLDRRGEHGGAYLHIYPQTVLLSPRSIDSLPGLRLPAGGEYVTAAEYRDYLKAYAAHHQLAVARAEVATVRRAPDGFVVETDGGDVHASAVIAATGMYDAPNEPKIPPTQARVLLHRDWRGPAAHPEQRVLVVGGATGAIELAEELARAGRDTVVSARSGVKIFRQKLFGLDLHHWIAPISWLPGTTVAKGFCSKRPTLAGTDRGFGALVRKGKIRVAGAIMYVEGKRFSFAKGEPFDADLVVLATGYRFEHPYLPADVERGAAGHLLTRRGESVSWPRLFAVGVPCAWRIDGEFLRGISSDAERVAQRIATEVKA